MKLHRAGILLIISISIIAGCSGKSDSDSGSAVIKVMHDDVAIASETGEYDFGYYLGPETVTFSIENSGSIDLTIASITSTNDTEFSVTQPVSTTIPPGVKTTFTVTYDTDHIGTETGVIEITNSDEDNSPFQFNVLGTARGTFAGCPEGAIDSNEDNNHVQISETSLYFGGICLAENQDDRYEVTVPASSNVNVTVESLSADIISLYLYDNVSFSDPPVGGGDGATSLTIQNTTDGDKTFYLLLYNAEDTVDTPYTINADY